VEVALDQVVVDVHVQHLVGLPVAPRHGNGGGEEGIPAGRR
jgi:hypothetical protein